MYSLLELIRVTLLTCAAMKEHMDTPMFAIDAKDVPLTVEQEQWQGVTRPT